VTADPQPVDQLDELRTEYANTGGVMSGGAVWLFSQVVVLRDQVRRLSAAAPATDRAALRDRIADAAVPILLDTLPKVIARARGYEIADAVLSALPDTARLHDEILTLQAELASMRDLLRTENERANAAIDRETTTEDAEEEQRLALSTALSLDTGAPWDAIRERAAELASVDRVAVLSDTDRKFLTFALDLAADQMASRGDEFDAEDEDSAERLRRVADETPQAETPACANCGKPVRLITGTLATWWVHDPGGHTICDPQQAATSPRATPADPAQPAKEA
jgi:hypothetical protein